MVGGFRGRSRGRGYRVKKWTYLQKYGSGLFLGVILCLKHSSKRILQKKSFLAVCCAFFSSKISIVEVLQSFWKISTPNQKIKKYIYIYFSLGQSCFHLNAYRATQQDELEFGKPVSVSASVSINTEFDVRCYRRPQIIKMHEHTHLET